jgi:predicted glycoside hydrolase/deacetylase ChbG (UPF0249 family)
MPRRLTRLAAALAVTLAGTSLSAQPPELLLRVDDIGMSHSVNMALEKLAATKAPASASVLFVCPWYQEAVEILKKNPQIAVGVHLALNSEWKGFRWGPVLGKEAVPSIVDSVGYFLPSTEAFLAQKYDLKDVERELSAQVERALHSGLKIDYVDYHMGTAVATPELRAVVERVAEKYGLGISRYFGERYKTLFDTPIAEKQRELLTHVGRLQPGTLNLVVVHMAEYTPEIGVLVDMNDADQNTAGGEPRMGRHRAAELAALLSPEFAKVRTSGRVKLVTYHDVMATRGRAGMARPIQ